MGEKAQLFINSFERQHYQRMSKERWDLAKNKSRTYEGDRVSEAIFAQLEGDHLGRKKGGRQRVQE